MKFRSAIPAILATAALFGSQAAHADPIAVDGGWVGFCFGAGGSAASAGCQNEATSVAGNPFTFSSVNQMILKITDAFRIGDSFRVNDGTNDILFTGPSGSGAELTNPDAAYAAGYYSSGSILLGPGSYSLSVFAVDSPFQGGGAYLRVDTAVPEPASLALMGLGLAGIGFMRRRRAG